MTVDIRKWGEAGWTLMYAVAFAYPTHPTPADQAGAIHFFEGLAAVLPCQDCRHHYTAYMQEFPIQVNVGSRNKLCAWLLNLHNAVNARIGKPIVTLEQVWADLVEDAPRTRRRCVAAGVCIVLALIGLAMGVAAMRGA